MSTNDDDRRAETLRLARDYLALIGQGRLDEWIELWAEDGVLEFPYAPAGRRGVYRGKADILAYMKHATSRIASDSVTRMRVFPMRDPGMATLELSIKGHIVGTEAPYDQTFVFFFEVVDGKLSRYREYWNPLILVDAVGGREAWTANFGFPEGPRAPAGETERRP